MRVIALSTLRSFWVKYPGLLVSDTNFAATLCVAPCGGAEGSANLGSDPKNPLVCLGESGRVDWETPAEIKEAYRSASFTANNRVVFNIKGNDYRLVVLVKYERGLIFVRFVGTHRQYDKIDVETI